MSTETLAIIGAGNMGASLVGGLIHQGFSPQQLWVTDTDLKKLQQLHSQFNVQITSNNQDAAKIANVIILAVKPQRIAIVAQELKESVSIKRPLIISIAAGVRESSLQKWLGHQSAIVRCMPNLPALVGMGATALFANSYVSDNDRQLAETILRAIGMTVWLDDENLMDAVTALSGSGPAYFFFVIEIMQAIGEKWGLSREMARALTLQTACGAARMAFDSPYSAEELRKQVTSPGGTTEAALQILEKGQFRELFTQALQAAYQRSRELAHEG